MSNTTSHLASRVREFRARKGMSQEVLAEESGLSHRTIQRIENGESNPTGDTLQRLSAALSVNPDELIDWTIKEDQRYLVLMNMSALSFLVFPMLGILIPFMMWVSKKDVVKDSHRTGADLINFQINWIILLVLLPSLLYLVGQIGLLESLSVRTIVLILVTMYLLNCLFILTNTIRISQKKAVRYYYLIRFLT